MRRCRFLLKDEHRALDAMQDTFVQLIRYKNRLTASAPSSLLYRIATNICLNMIRMDKNKSVAAGNDILLNIAYSEDHEKSFIEREILNKIFQPEKPTTREIAVMYYVDGMTLEQVAKEIGLSVSGVRKRLRNLKTRISGSEEVYG